MQRAQSPEHKGHREKRKKQIPRYARDDNFALSERVEARRRR